MAPEVAATKVSPVKVMFAVVVIVPSFDPDSEKVVVSYVTDTHPSPPSVIVHKSDAIIFARAADPAQ